MARVGRAVESTPYSVTATPDGFELRTNIADDQWREHLRRQGVAQAHLHHVAIQAMTYQVTSDSRDLAWGTGVPVLASPADVRRVSRGKKDGSVADRGGMDAPSGRDPFGPEVGRRLVTAVGEELGMTQRQTGRRLEIILTAAAIITTVVLSFAVAVWVLFLR